MLVQFTVGNYLSFKEPVTFSMVASSIKEHAETHLIEVTSNYTLLKTSALYGANASGKSNLFKAMAFMRNFIENSSKNMQAEEPIRVEPFKLSTETVNAPSLFEIVFIYKGVKYRYGFEVNNRQVLSEWLFYTPKTREVELFVRSAQEFKVGRQFKEGDGLEGKTRNNALFLSVVAQFNGEISIRVLKWLTEFHILRLSDGMDFQLTNSILEENQVMKRNFVDFLRVADMGIEEIEFREFLVPINTLEEYMSKMRNFYSGHSKAQPELLFTVNSEVKMSHNKYSQENNVIGVEKFDLQTQESEGTKKLYSLLGPILVALSKGRVLVVDELDSSLHPLITLFIIKLFHSSKNNPLNAQLIFNTHDTNLLSNKVFRRDQIWFFEKDRYGATDLYSLIEYKVRNDASFEKDYLLGKYGSIPFIGDFQFNSEDECQGDDENRAEGGKIDGQ